MRTLAAPVVQFLLIGLLIYGAWKLKAGEEATAPNEIRVGAAELQWLRDTWIAQFGHAPTAVEMKSAVDGYVAEEMRYREGLALGLDRDDTIVRRRLAQKYDFMMGAQAADTQPDDAELSAYFRKQAARYVRPPLTSFCQVYMGAGAGAAREAASALGRLPAADLGRAEADPGGHEGLPYPRCYRSASPQDLTRDFGAEFATAVSETLVVGRWQGPVASGYGAHLVIPTARSLPAPLSFDEAKPAVLVDWRAEAALAAKSQQDLELRARYRVTVDQGALRRLVGTAP